MKREEHLLIILGEECVETAQRVSKALRFGLKEVQPEHTLCNSERIIYEFNDIDAVMEILKDEGYLEKVINREAIEKKKEKVKKYMKHSIDIGILKK